MHIETAILSGGVIAAAAAVQAIAAGKVTYEEVNGRADADCDSLTGEKPSVTLTLLAALLVLSLQMGNVSIPGTGSSGHVIGSILLALLLGSRRAFLAIGAILAVQAFCFGDGGIEALGANWLNMGLIPCLLVYPLLRRHSRSWRSVALLAPLVSSVLGAVAASAEIAASGIIALHAGQLFLHMTAIHFIIGAAEGMVTLALASYAEGARTPALSWSMAAASVFIVTVSVLWASSAPDGLEWSLVNSAR